MMNRLKALPAALLLVAATSLQAQEDGIVLSAGLLVPQGDAAQLTQKSKGYGFQIGYLMHPKGYGVAFMPYLGHQIMPGKDVDYQTTYNLAANFVGVDMLYRIKALPLDLYTGPSFHAWQVERRGGDPTTTNVGDQNWKLGWRLGVKYSIDKDWSVSAAFTQTMWRSRADLDWVEGLNPSRPAYFSILANYRF